MSFSLYKYKRLTIRIFNLIFFVGVLWAFGFAGFLLSVQNQTASKTRADGIVVLTGGPGRIDEGFAVLSSGRGARLLISGVNQTLDNQTILQAIGQGQELLECCVDPGRNATDTKSNALEAAAWAKEKNFKSIILITADFHMPRSLNAFTEFAPDLKIISHPVVAEVSPLTVMLEYNKYLLSLADIDLKT